MLFLLVMFLAPVALIGQQFVSVNTQDPRTRLRRLELGKLGAAWLLLDALLGILLVLFAWNLDFSGLCENGPCKSEQGNPLPLLFLAAAAVLVGAAAIYLILYNRRLERRLRRTGR
jgi:H+/Cl- antiporter ClcA